MDGQLNMVDWYNVYIYGNLFQPLILGLLAAWHNTLSMEIRSASVLEEVYWILYSLAYFPSSNKPSVKF
jgi:hypothetical protein